MNAERLLAEFDRLSEAPDAVGRLRHWVLNLAVRGQLVEQDPNDQPAAMLFAEIQQQRARAGVPGTKGKAATTMSEAHPSHPFSLPANWIWTQLGDVLLKLTDGTHHSPPNLPSGDFLYVSAKNIKQHGVSLHSVSYVTAAEHRDIFARCNPTKGDVLYVKDGATTGVVTINDLDEPFSMLSSVALLKVPKGIYNRLLVAFLRSPFFYDQMRGFMKGAALPRVTLKRMAPAVLPLPPLAEQHRIVAKVDQLMSVCDQLEAAQAERERRRDRLAVASFTSMQLTARSAAGHREQSAANPIARLSRLVTSTRHVPLVRETIVELAVTGHLAGTKRTSSSWPRKATGDILARLQTGPFGTSLHQSDYALGGTPVINPASMQNGRIVPSAKMAVGSAVLERLANFKLRAGDVVMARRGEMGRCAVVQNEQGGWLCGTGSLILRPKADVLPSYLALFLGSPRTRDFLNSASVGATMQNLNQRILLSLTVLLPPLAEQRRIVAKVAELMAVCDQLDQSLTTEQTARARLLEALLHDALANALPSARALSS